MGSWILGAKIKGVVQQPFICLSFFRILPVFHRVSDFRSLPLLSKGLKFWKMGHDPISLRLLLEG